MVIEDHKLQRQENWSNHEVISTAHSEEEIRKTGYQKQQQRATVAETRLDENSFECIILPHDQVEYLLPNDNDST